MDTVYKIIYDLSEYEELGYLPSAFVANTNEQGTMTYVAHKVHAQTITDYGLELSPERQQLFEVIDLLQIKALEEKFNGKSKRKKNIQKLIIDKDVKRTIVKYIHRKLGVFLSLIKKHQLLLSLNTNRKDYIPSKQIKALEYPLTPQLFFKRTKEQDVLYRLSFMSNKSYWRITQRDVFVLCNEPGWIVANRVLWELPAINGNMVKPFIKKDEIRIPKHYTKEYFQKFILRVAAQADIEAEGFTVISNDKLSGCEVTFAQNFMDKTYGLSLHFRYDQLRFHKNESTSQKTDLKFDTNDDIIIYQYRRNSAQEEDFVKKLNNFPLREHHGLFVPTDLKSEPNSDQVMQWLVAQKTNLEAAGFEVIDPNLEGKPILLQTPVVELNVSKDKDWFDLHGNVTVGSFTFPFIKLAEYIGSGNRFYPLPDGRFFLIPEEWMAKYEEIFRMGKLNDEGVRVIKSRFSVLQNLELEQQDSQSKKTLSGNYKRVRYKPPETLKATLRPYQLEGVKWLIHLYKNDLGGCLADDMGLGKTLQTIAVLLYAKEQKDKANPSSKKLPNATQFNLFDDVSLDGKNPLNALIVLPASLVFNWKNEIKKYAPSLSVYAHTGIRRYRSASHLQGFDVILTTYHTALKDVEMLRQIEFEYIILDESQQIKNRESKIFGAVNDLDAKHKVSLSGTPIENSLSDLWSQMQFINPELLGSFPFFKKEFLKPIEKMQNEEKKNRLRRLITPYLLRRTKEEVAKDLPELTQKVFYSEMTPPQKKVYEREKSTARNFILENIVKGNPKFNMVVLKTLLRLRQIANHPSLYLDDYAHGSGKFDDIIHHLEVLKKGGHKALIFSQFVSYLGFFKAAFEKAGWTYSMLTGDMNVTKREAAIKNFQENKDTQFFLISLKAGGTGLNLTSADYVFIADPWWNPSAERQAIARAHRIGQTQNVIAMKFITKDTIEEKILKLQEKKTKLAEDIIENSDKIRFEKEDLEFLLE